MSLSKSATALGVLLLLATPACGDDGAASLDAAIADAAVPDAISADAGPLNPATCPSSYGFGSIFTTLQVPEDHPSNGPVGFDLDVPPDGTIDNGLADLAGLLNPMFTNDINLGDLRTLTELRDLTSLTADDSDMKIVLYGGVDSDVPAEISDDFDGTEDYYFDHEWVDPADCNPKAQAAATFAGGVITASADSFQFYVASLGGFVQIKRARLSAAVEADTEGAKTSMIGMFGGVIEACPLSRSSAAVGQNALHALVQFFTTQPDMDMDGDGLETIQTDSAGVISCTDGDGTTVIMGEACACDPRFADGFSITLQFDAVGATVLGPEPSSN